MSNKKNNKNLFTTKDGRIFFNGEEKHQSISNGYKRVWLNGGYEYSHRLIALEHIPNPDTKPFINHINGNKGDNRVENLEWVTARENTEHSRLSGLCSKGSTTKNLTFDEYLLIHLYRFKFEFTYRQLANIFNRDYRAIWDVINGLRYKDYHEKMLANIINELK
jgi:hypothetical protein